MRLTVIFDIRHSIIRCYSVCYLSGYHVFALQDGGWCGSSATAENTYKKFGESTDCPADGEGGPALNQVYKIHYISEFTSKETRSLDFLIRLYYFIINESFRTNESSSLKEENLPLSFRRQRKTSKTQNTFNCSSYSQCRLRHMNIQYISREF